MSMYEDPMIDPVGPLIVEMREDTDVESLVAGRVRAFEPLGVSKTYEGDALGPGQYKAFIVVTPLSIPPHPRLPITDATFGFICYGSDVRNAWAVYAAVVKAVHQTGLRDKSSGIAFYQSLVTDGGSEDRDPDTKQPRVSGAIRLIAGSQVPV